MKRKRPSPPPLSTSFLRPSDGLRKFPLQRSPPLRPNLRPRFVQGPRRRERARNRRPPLADVVRRPRGGVLRGAAQVTVRQQRRGRGRRSFRRHQVEQTFTVAVGVSAVRGRLRRRWWRSRRRRRRWRRRRRRRSQQRLGIFAWRRPSQRRRQRRRRFSEHVPVRRPRLHKASFVNRFPLLPLR